jgi:hypothetical protein
MLGWHFTDYLCPYALETRNCTVTKKEIQRHSRSARLLGAPKFVLSNDIHEGASLRDALE